MSLKPTKPVHLFRSISKGALVAVAFQSILSCGQDKAGQYISIAVDPTNTYVVPGPVQSCTDIATGINGTTGTINQSVQGPLVYFPNFKLQWQHPTDELTISVLLVTFNGGPVSNAQIVLGNTELADLLGKNLGIVGKATTINSDGDTTNGLNIPPKTGAPCGLAVGPIPIPAGSGVVSLQVTITVIGTSKDSSGKLTPVRKVLSASAQTLF